MRTQKLLGSLLLLTSLVFGLVACEEGQVTGGADQGSGGGTGGGTTGGTTDVKKIVSTGPSLTFNDFTGGPSDLAVNPSTSTPGVAYYDKSSTAGGSGTTVGALKYAYQDAYGAWNIEVVDFNYSTTGLIACGTVNSFCIGAPNAAAPTTYGDIIAIAYKSTGLPVIAYVYGASAGTTGGFKQIRLAERDSSGNWSISVAASYTTAVAVTNVAIATIEPIKGIELGIDSSGNPHVTYAWYAQTTTANSYQKYLYRNAAGTWTETNMFSNCPGAGTVTAAGTGTVQSGLVICTIGGNQYIAISSSNVSAAAAAAQTPVLSLAALNQSTGAGTFTNYYLGGITTLGVTTSCTGPALCFTTTPGTVAGIRTSVACRPDGKAEIGIFSTTNAAAATALVTGVTPLSIDNVATQTVTANAWGALSSSGTAQDGAGGFELAIASSDTGSVMGYVRSTTLAMFSRKNLGGTWVTGSTIETSTFGAGEGVGFTYDSTNDVAYMSYARLPAAAALATGNDLIMASGSTVDMVASAYNIFGIDLIDQTANATPTTAFPMLSAAKNAAGTIGYAYYYHDATSGTDSKLYYGTKGGTSTNPQFGQNLVINYVESTANTMVGAYPSLAYDGNNQPLIAFHNQSLGEMNLQLARSSNNGVTFAIQTIDDTSLTTGLYPSVSATGTAIGIAYYEVGPATQTTALRFARYIPGKGWKRMNVDGVTGVTGSGCSTTADAGKYAALKFTSDGKPVIVYQRDNGVFIAVATVAVTSTSLDTSTWTCRALDAGANVRGEGIDLALSSTDIPSIVHFDATSFQVRHVYSTYTASVAATITTGAFSAESIAGVGSTITVSQKPQIEIGTDGTKWVTYYNATTQGLGLANKSTSASSWTTETIDANTGGASYTSQAGLYSSLVINSSDKPACFYRSNENWIKWFSRESN